MDAETQAALDKVTQDLGKVSGQLNTLMGALGAERKTLMTKYWDWIEKSSSMHVASGKGMATVVLAELGISCIGYGVYTLWITLFK